MLRHGTTGTRAFHILQGNVTVLEPCSDLDIAKKDAIFQKMKADCFKDIKVLFKELKKSSREIEITNENKVEFCDENSCYKCLFVDNV